MIWSLYFSDRMEENIKKESDVNECIMEDTCFVDIREDGIKLENMEIQGKLDNPDGFTF